MCQLDVTRRPCPGCGWYQECHRGSAEWQRGERALLALRADPLALREEGLLQLQTATDYQTVRVRFSEGERRSRKMVGVRGAGRGGRMVRDANERAAAFADVIQY